MRAGRRESPRESVYGREGELDRVVDLELAAFRPRFVEAGSKGRASGLDRLGQVLLRHGIELEVPVLEHGCGRGAEARRDVRVPTREDNRGRNREYEAAAEDMFARTEHDLSPWDVLSGEHKRLARVRTVQTVNRRIEAGMKRWGWQVPPFEELDEVDSDPAD